jgi:hypothetical protein
MAPFSALRESRAGLRFAEAYSCAAQDSMVVVRRRVSGFVRIDPGKRQLSPPETRKQPNCLNARGAVPEGDPPGADIRWYLCLGFARPLRCMNASDSVRVDECCVDDELRSGQGAAYTARRAGPPLPIAWLSCPPIFPEGRICQCFAAWCPTANPAGLRHTFATVWWKICDCAEMCGLVPFLNPNKTCTGDGIKKGLVAKGKTA